MRFTIRDLMWLMVVVAFYLGWWIHNRDARRQRLDSAARIAAQTAELERKNAQIGALQENLTNLRADERAARQQLAEFVETQDDRAKIDVAPGLFHRVAAPK
jgi:septal ring factor EnvC (AmiA/AmiB activator)